MKRRKVMRLLAVAMAASLAVTSQGIPAGLTSVYAADPESDTVKEALKSAGEAGALFKELTESQITTHTHKQACYNNSDKVVEVKSGDKYYTKSDGTYTLVDPNTFVDTSQSATLYEEYEATQKGTQVIVNKNAASPDADPVYETHDVATADEVNAIEAAQKLKDKESNTKLVSLDTTTVEAIKAVYTDKSAKATEGTGIIDLNAASLDASITSTADVFEVVEYTKATGDGAAGVVGAVTIPNSATHDTYPEDKGFTDLTENTVYVPIAVKAYTPDYTNVTTVTAGSSDAAVTWVKGGTVNAITWYNQTASTSQPGEYYSYIKETDGTVTCKIKVVTAATVNDKAEGGHAGTYTYSYTDAAGESKTKTGSLTDSAIVTVNDNGKDRVFLDVSDLYVTGIAVADKDSSGTAYPEITYLAADVSAADASRDVLLSFGKGGNDTAPEDVRVEATNVTTNYESISGTDTKVSVTQINSAYKYVNDTDNDYIIESGEEVAISTLNGAEAFKTAGLATATLDIPVMKITAPTVNVSVTTGTQLLNGDSPITDETYGAIYDVTSTNVVLTAGVTNDSAPEGYTWKYTWKDLTGATFATDANANAKADANMKTYTITKAANGAHQVKFVAQLWKNGTTDKAVFEKVYDETKLSAVVEDTAAKTAGVSGLTDLTYSKDGVTATPAVIATSQGEVTYKYYDSDGNNESSSLPTNVGSYKVKATIAADYLNGYKETVVETDFAIAVNKLTAEGSKLVDSYDEANTGSCNSHTVSLSSILAATEAGDSAVGSGVTEKEDAKFETLGNDSIFESVSYNTTSGELTYVLNEKAVTDANASTYVTEDITGTLVVGGYEIAVTYTVKINKKGYTTADITLKDNSKTYYYGDQDSTYDLKADIIDTPADGDYTFTYQKQGETNAAELTSFPTDAGTYAVTINYKKTEAQKTTTGEAHTTLTITPKPVTITITNQTASIVEGDALPDITFTATKGEGSDLSTTAVDALKTYMTYTKGDGTVVAEANVKDTPGEYTISVDKTAIGANYNVTSVTTATLIVKKILNLTATNVKSVVNNAPNYNYTLTDKSGTTVDKPTTATVKYALSNTSGDVDGNPTTAGEYTIKPSFEFNDGTTSSKLYEVKATNGTLTVVEAAIKVTVVAGSKTITVGDSFTPVITVTETAGNTTLDSSLASYKIYKTSVSDENETTLQAAIGTAGTYIIVPYMLDAVTYEATPTNGTLTVNPVSTYNPPADTDKTPSTTTEPTLTTNEDGDKVIVDADGKVIANELVTTSDGKSYVTDEDGVIRTSQIAEVGDVKVYVGKNGVVATDKAVTYEGKKYYATENGEIATNRFVETARGNKVYATKTGALKTSTAFTVKGKKYYAKASGVIATTGFVKTAKGNTVYATKSGALQVNKAFKASNGKKYVADKNGKIVKGKKITIGKKTYTTNKKGVIIKVTTKKR